MSHISDWPLKVIAGKAKSCWSPPKETLNGTPSPIISCLYIVYSSYSNHYPISIPVTYLYILYSSYTPSHLHPTLSKHQDVQILLGIRQQRQGWLPCNAVFAGADGCTIAHLGARFSPCCRPMKKSWHWRQLHGVIVSFTTHYRKLGDHMINIYTYLYLHMCIYVYIYL